MPAKGTNTRSRLLRFALAMIVGGMLLTASLGVGSVAANSGQDHRPDATFTKWVTTFPDMAGVVGGPVGPGAFVGKILDYNPGSVTVIDAIYHVNGSKHSFIALVHVEQTGLKAVIVGVVTSGWEKGDLVKGEYRQINCNHDGITTVCFRGVLDIVPGSDR